MPHAVLCARRTPPARRVRWPLLIAACITAGITPGLGAAEEPAGELVWFGTYTGGRSGSEGIYVSRFDPATGRLGPAVLAATATNPSFLAAAAGRPLLYAVAEGGGQGGTLAAFTIDEATGRLTSLGSQPSGGGGPCHVCTDPAGRVVLAANYGGGSVVCLGTAANGSLKPVVAGSPGGFIQHRFDREGTPGIDPRRQERPHAHSVDVSPDGRFAFCCDLGLDEVLISRLDTERATISPHGSAAVAAGSGPRHFAIHPGGRFAWCVNELSLTVTGFSWDAAAGRLTEIETLSTLPADVVDRTGFSCAEIAVHPSGRFLYASTRGHDSIAIYRIDEASGRLTFLGVEPTRAKTPRNFAIAPGGRFLLAAGQDSDNVTVFAIDETSGRLTFTGESLEVPRPVCVLFRP